MVMWDLTFDPNSSTVRQWWIWKDGGAYFGVPVTNFLGWYLTVFSFMLIFAWWMRGSRAQADVSGVDAIGRRGTWLAGVAIYFAMGLVQVPMESIAGGAQVIDGSGQLWNVVALQQALGLVTLFTMGTVVALALQAIGTAGGREPRTSRQ